MTTLALALASLTLFIPTVAAADCAAELGDRVSCSLSNGLSHTYVDTTLWSLFVCGRTVSCCSFDLTPAFTDGSKPYLTIYSTDDKYIYYVTAIENGLRNSLNLPYVTLHSPHSISHMQHVSRSLR
jgi:hypothetical protein